MRGMKVIAFAAGAACLVFGQAAIAATDPANSDQTAAAPPLKNDTGKRVCRVLTPTGSRFTTRVCKTAEEWQRDEQKAQNQMEQERRGNADLDAPPPH